MNLGNTTQSKAFELYYSLGTDRNYKKVAEELGVTSKTISKWSKIYEWDKIIQEKKNISLSQEIAELQKKVIIALLNNTIEAINKGHISLPINAVKDFQTLLELINNSDTSGTDTKVMQFPLEYQLWLSNKLDQVENKSNI